MLFANCNYLNATVWLNWKYNGNIYFANYLNLHFKCQFQLSTKTTLAMTCEEIKL